MGYIDESKKSLVVLPKFTTLNIRSLSSVTSPVLAVAKQSEALRIGVTTGLIAEEQGSNNYWYQIYFSPEFKSDKKPAKEYGWVRSDVISLITQSEYSTIFGDGNPGQSIVNALIENDKKVWKNLALSKAYIDKLKSKNISVSKYQPTYDLLLAKFNDRQNALKTSTALKVQTGTNAAWDSFVKDIGKYDTSMSMMGIGAFPFAIVIGAIVGIVATISVYYIFRPKYEEGKVHLKVSSDLAKALESVDAETAAAIKADLQKQIDKAYNAGKTAGQWGAIWDIAKYPLVFIGAYIAFDKLILPQINKHKK